MQNVLVVIIAWYKILILFVEIAVVICITVFIDFVSLTFCDCIKFYELMEVLIYHKNIIMFILIIYYLKLFLFGMLYFRWKSHFNCNCNKVTKRRTTFNFMLVIIMYNIMSRT